LLSFSTIASAAQAQDKPFVIVELFSSEGCSSCPPADFLVSQLTAWARQKNVPVYPLVFHVDYWNYLGWRDVFSNVAFTQRQYEYSYFLKGQGVYTPQMIVNGRDAFIGSDQGELQKDLDRELLAPASLVLHIDLTKQSSQIIVHYQVEGYSNGDVINFALVERGLSTKILAGENAGLTLHYDNVVKEFQTIPLREAASQITFSLGKILDTKQASVIAYVQDMKTMLIKDAKQVDVEHD